ncbi:MAG TPA: MucB/RseB C-terminal domain-containing protein [Rhodanobacteraceae bacterium]|nr:MucB/RseB C-terminal domain-containing protein [Rhodanobacteraceae bacterium]
MRRMSASLRRVDFQGSFIYQHDGRTDALRIFHEGGETERERLVSLSGPRGEIIRDGHAITCVQPNAVPTLFANRADMQLLPLVPNIRELGAQYSVNLAGVDRVAGYDARIVDIVPRDPYRYGYRLWVQQGNQLLLRSAVVDGARRPLAQFMFVALDIGAKPSETDLTPTGNVGSAASPMDETTITTKPFWNVADAPAGFRLVRTQRPLGGTTRAEHLVYTDGIASVSVYVEPDPQPASAVSESTIVHGAVSVHSLDAGGMHVTALGDVPPATVEAMARSVRSNTTDERSN